MRSLHRFPLLAACALFAAGCGDDPTAPILELNSVTAFIPSHAVLRAKLRQILEQQNGGLGFDMWATILDRDGRVVDVVFSGENRGDQWPGSRVVASSACRRATRWIRTLPTAAARRARAPPTTS